jgi:hypothetical protein
MERLFGAARLRRASSSRMTRGRPGLGEAGRQSDDARAARKSEAGC